MAALHIGSLRQAFFNHRALFPSCRRYFSAARSTQSPDDSLPDKPAHDVAVNGTADNATSDSTPVGEPAIKKRGRPKTKLDLPKKKKLKGTVRLQPGEVLPEISAGWELPPLDMWRKYFPVEKQINFLRPAVRNPETAAMLAEAFVPDGSRDKIIIDACPGPGQLTRALLKLPKERIKKIVVLEPSKHSLKFLKPLEVLDSRVKVYPRHGKAWEAYSQLRENGDLNDVVEHDWNEVHPQLQFIMHMHSSVEGEQLISQLFRCIPDRQWLFKYGRIPLHFVLSSRIWERITAPEGTMARCKLSVIAQATAEFSQTVDPEVLQPYSTHFHPETLYNVSLETRSNALDPRRMGAPQHVVTALPALEPKILKGDLDLWDFVLRKLFVLKATNLEKCLNTNALGPGSRNLIPKLTDGILSKDPRGLTLDDWKMVVQEFKNWPFRPEEIGIEAFHDVSSKNR